MEGENTSPMSSLVICAGMESRESFYVDTLRNKMVLLSGRTGTLLKSRVR